MAPQSNLIYLSLCNLYCCNSCPCLYDLVGERKFIYLFYFIYFVWLVIICKHVIVSNIVQDFNFISLFVPQIPITEGRKWSVISSWRFKKLLLRLHMWSDIKEKILSAKGIYNKLLGSTLKQLGCWLTLFLSGSMSVKWLKSLMLLQLFKFNLMLLASSAGFLNNSWLLLQYY